MLKISHFSFEPDGLQMFGKTLLIVPIFNYDLQE